MSRVDYNDTDASSPTRPRSFPTHLHLFRVPPEPTIYSSPPPERQLASTGPSVFQSPVSNLSRSTLLWANLEPWMDEEYVKQVCALMVWDPINIKVPQPAPDSSGHHANNPGYCFLTFPSPAQAASVLAQICPNGKSTTLTMPNSSKPFVLSWAPAVPPSLPSYPYTPQYQKEYSIFVGDLAPETSNSDLVAVFRNPVLGLRNDREPKFIRPFLSCKSAKIMLDPVTGVSRGYGFVRFTDEADQQRALIEMHGLYCLSRPMRISPATAKFKSPPPGLPQVVSPNSSVVLPLAADLQAKSVSAPIAAVNSNSSFGSNSVQGSSSNNSMGDSSSGGSLSSNNSAVLPQGFSNPDHDSAKLGNGTGVPSLLSEAQLRQVLTQTDGYPINEESWKHHAQARAILGNLIGPNGEQLTSTDPYNTTVFVGGLSPLISEETLRTFFAPFGDIHYVKIPVGKHCGFVQFVRKVDAERAIEKMQGFHIGGSRIRLSWGRSQYKAAQAAAQAAQTAALQAHYTSTTPTGNAMTPDQALSLLHKLSQQGYITATPPVSINDIPSANGGIFASNLTSTSPGSIKLQSGRDTQNLDTATTNGFMDRPEIHRTLSNFSPFSHDSHGLVDEFSTRETSFTRAEVAPYPSKTFTPGFYSHQLQSQDFKLANGTFGAGISKYSPSTRPPSASRYGPYSDMHDRTISRLESSSRSSSGNNSHLTSSHQLAGDRDDLEDMNLTLANLKFLDEDRGHSSPEANGFTGAGLSMGSCRYPHNSKHSSP